MFTFTFHFTEPRGVDSVTVITLLAGLIISSITVIATM